MRPAGGDSAAGRKRVVGMERPEEPRLRIVRADPRIGRFVRFPWPLRATQNLAPADWAA